MQKELTAKIFGLSLIAQLLQLRGRSCSEYLKDGLMRLWISGGLSGTNLIKKLPFKARFMILPKYMVLSMRSKISNPQLKAERQVFDTRKKKVANHGSGGSRIITQMNSKDKFPGMKERCNFTAVSNYRS